jgi:hypothetical protein
MPATSRAVLEAAAAVAAAAARRRLLDEDGDNSSAIGEGDELLAGLSSVDPSSSTLGPLPDLYKVNTSAVTVGFILLAAVLVLFMQLGCVDHFRFSPRTLLRQSEKC